MKKADFNPIQMGLILQRGGAGYLVTKQHIISDSILVIAKWGQLEVVHDWQEYSARKLCLPHHHQASNSQRNTLEYKMFVHTGLQIIEGLTSAPRWCFETVINIGLGGEKSNTHALKITDKHVQCENHLTPL